MIRPRLTLRRVILSSAEEHSGHGSMDYVHARNGFLCRQRLRAGFLGESLRVPVPGIRHLNSVPAFANLRINVFPI